MYYIAKSSKPATTPPQSPPPEPVAPADMPPPEQPEGPPAEPAPGDETPPAGGEGTPGPTLNDDPGAPPPDEGGPGETGGDEGGAGTDEPPVAPECSVTSMVLSQDGKHRRTVKTPGKTAWYTVSPEASGAVSFSFDSEHWGQLVEAKASAQKVRQRLRDYRDDPKAAEKKWKKSAVDRARNMFSLTIERLYTREGDCAEITIESAHACGLGIEQHKLTTSASGVSQNQGLTAGSEPGTWLLKARPPSAAGRGAHPRTYTILLPECAPGTDQLIAKVSVFPERQESIEFTFQAKRFNQISKKIARCLEFLGDRLDFDVEVGTLFIAGMQGWYKQDDGYMAYERQLSGGAKPLMKVEVSLKISALECCTGIPKECWDYIADIGVFFTIGGSLGASVAYTDRYLYTQKKTERELSGTITGKLYNELGLYAHAGPKDIAEVSVEAGARFGITAQGSAKYLAGSDLGMDASLEIDPVKLFVTIRTKFMWVFGSEHPCEWDLTDKYEIWRDDWTIMKFDTPGS